MTQLQPTMGRDYSISAQIWASPMWPMMAALAVIGCAGLGLAHSHGHVATHAQSTISAEADKMAGGSLTPTTFARTPALPASQAQ